jgi:hypothetical protein
MKSVAIMKHIDLLPQLTTAQLGEVQTRYAMEPSFVRALEDDSVKTLREAGLDGAIPYLCDSSCLSELLGKVPPAAVTPTLASIRLIISDEVDYEINNFTSVNAQAVVNVVAAANAAAYHEAAAATMVVAAAVVVAVAGLVFTGVPSPQKGERMSAPSLRLADGFDGQTVLDRLAERGTSNARQLTLLRRAALDGEVLASTLNEDGFEVKKTRYEVDDMVIELECLVGINEVVLLDCVVAARVPMLV